MLQADAKLSTEFKNRLKDVQATQILPIETALQEASSRIEDVHLQGEEKLRSLSSNLDRNRRETVEALAKTRTTTFESIDRMVLDSENLRREVEKR